MITLEKKFTLGDTWDSFPKMLFELLLETLTNKTNVSNLPNFYAHLRAILEPLITFQWNGPYQWHFDRVKPIPFQVILYLTTTA